MNDDDNDLHLISQELLARLAFGLDVETAREVVRAVAGEEPRAGMEASPVVRIGDSLTLLHLAVQAPSLEVVEFLLSIGHPTEVRTVVGETPLDQAAWLGLANVAGALLAGGANPNCATDLGYTPLHRCAYYGHPQLAAKLLLMGANKDLVDSNGDKPYDCAVAQGHDSIASMLQPNMVNGVELWDAVYVPLEAFRALETMERRLAGTDAPGSAEGGDSFGSDAADLDPLDE
ncbi:uncharacterized protein AMSG_02315 [Thecamonas trahens ATCC 50062]|uniref:Uncharacterized protein n=1 Tax=Thecamonas trahens ATCC 50062 TaxID=461836 RepID=A0A0L0DVK2_THETB|nr:hypothetical protein AMSG_02315 [Thecamonas trahens ATCC 50062]KNC56344.1 hypothetical protein AMSG_02315 [Thecamonas trahens ATCC 50062]|eukprot:XP_013760861.1 hypothetical protein AMSG_02315 [Thecamonas trahens ATCC 50062]